MIKTDYHMHTTYSPDASNTIQQMIEKAIQLGLSEIALTDHVDFIPDGRRPDNYIDYNKYIEELKQHKARYGDKINIILGVELGVEPQLKDKLEKFASSFPFEFIIGSSHNTHQQDLWLKTFYENKDKKTAYSQHLEEILENVKTLDCFDVYGHLDYISRYGTYEDKTLRYAEFSDHLDEIFKTLIYRGKGIEVNTSGYKYGFNRPHPDKDILEAYKRLGGEILTIGSDSHCTSTLAGSFDKTEAILKQVGFKYYTLFRDRKPVMVAL